MTGTRPCGLSAETRFIQPAEVAASRDVLVVKPEFAHQPKHLLHVEGIAASPHLQHARTLPSATP
jgi:hypothetical protein